MLIRGTEIVDTFAEAFPMTAARAIVTAADRYWCETVAQVATGFGTSVIACDCEAGVERHLDPPETPDGRPGVSLLFFAFSRDKLGESLVRRVGQCVLTCPTTACYDGLPLGSAGADPERRLRVGSVLRYFGDGFQTSKKLFDRRFWRIPTLDGEFACEESFGTVKGVAGGNLLILGTDEAAALAGSRRAVEAMRPAEGIILPFPGGVVRSGSKVGSKYPKLIASTADAYCPTLRGVVESKLPPEVNCAYEIVVDGFTEDAVKAAMRRGALAACGTGVVQVSAGNYGGKLGPFHLKLHEILANDADKDPPTATR